MWSPVQVPELDAQLHPCTTRGRLSQLNQNLRVEWRRREAGISSFKSCTSLWSPKRKGEGRGINQEVGINRDTLLYLAFPGGSASKESAFNEEDSSLTPGSGRSSGQRHGYPVQYSCLENPMGSRVWQATKGLQRVRHNLATNTHTIIFKINNQQGKDSSPGISTQYSVITYMGRESEIHIHTYTYVCV